MKHIVRTIALSTVAATTLALASCGTSSHSSSEMSGADGVKSSAPAAGGPAATGAKNKVDVSFATGMIPHHAQAVEMAEIAPGKAVNPAVKALAAEIKKAQGPEIARMSGWLTGWGEPIPGTAGGHDMSESGAPMDGMLSTKEMTDLGKATGSEFDRMWLKSMIAHHEGAVVMAKTELSRGVNPEVKKLAQAIIDSQSAEIAEMKSIQATISG